MNYFSPVKFVAAVLTASLLVSSLACAHSASNAYLTVRVMPQDPLIHGQWDVALRDLEFVLGLNAKNDGKLTWGEVLNRKTDIQRYVYDHLALSAGGKSCAVEPQSMQVDDHADGAYVALFFIARCADQALTALDVGYSLFFEIDPTHRGIFVLQNGQTASTALFAPENAKVQVPLKMTK